MDSLEIAIVSSWMGHVRGGAEINDLRLGNALEELGHDVVYYTFVDERRDPEPLPDNCHTVSLRYLLELSYAAPWPAGKLVRHLNTTAFVRRLAAADFKHLQEADLVLTTGRPQLAHLKRHVSGTQFHAVRSTVNPLYKRYLEYADGLVFWGGVREEYDDARVLSRPNVSVDPAVDTDTFSPEPRPDLGSELRNGNPDTTVLTFVGRLVNVKQVDLLIEAVGELKQDRDSPIKLVVLGDGQKRDDLEVLADDLLADGEVRFTGRLPREQVPAYLNASDIFVMSSATENHPIALKEALVSGTFCVAPAVGRIPDLLSADGAGTTYSPTTAGVLASTLEAVLEDEKHKEMTAEQRSTQFHTWSDNASEIVALYREVQK